MLGRAGRCAVADDYGGTDRHPDTVSVARGHPVTRGKCRDTSVDPS
jgi:hypothetical protein